MITYGRNLVELKTHLKIIMNHLLLTTLILSGIFQAYSQDTKQYKFTTAEGDSIRNFTVNLPANWYITNETGGTPYSVIGIEPSTQQIYDLNKCSPEMRVGISISQKTVDETLKELGLQTKDSNICLFKDTDEFINIIVLFSINKENVNGLHFSFDKLTSCPSGEEGKKKKQKRQTMKKQYILFSYQNTTICFESFNGDFHEEVFNLIKWTFKINT